MSIGQIIILSIIGLAGGGIIAAGVFALITTTGVMTRFAEKTHTAKYVRQYENAVAFGAILFNIFWVFELNYEGMKLGNQLLALIGLCRRMFGNFSGRGVKCDSYICKKNEVSSRIELYCVKCGSGKRSWSFNLFF